MSRGDGMFDYLFEVMRCVSEGDCGEEITEQCKSVRFLLTCSLLIDKDASGILLLPDYFAQIFWTKIICIDIALKTEPEFLVFNNLTLAEGRAGLKWERGFRVNLKRSDMLNW